MTYKRRRAASSRRKPRAGYGPNGGYGTKYAGRKRSRTTKRYRKSRRTTRSTIPRSMSIAMDRGVQYARLLANPESAPLVHPTYPGSNGMLVRTSQDFTLAVAGTAGETGVFWTPALAMTFGTARPGYLEHNGTAYASPGSLVSQMQFVPGLSLLAGASATGGVASMFRVIAAAIEMTYIGSNDTLSGLMYMGNFNGGQVQTGAATIAGGIGAHCTTNIRTSNMTQRIRWMPGEDDENYKIVTNNGVSQNPPNEYAYDNNSLFCGVSGLAAGSNIRFRLIACYEYIPVIGSGVLTPGALEIPPTSISTQQANAIAGGTASSQAPPAR